MNYFLDDYGFKIPEIPGVPATGYTFCAEYQTVYDAFFEKPAADIAQQQDIMVRALIVSGFWATRDCFYVTAVQNAVDSQLNWVNPGTYDLIPNNFLAGDFTPYGGWAGNGLTSFLGTQYTASLHAINYGLNSASAGAYITTNVDEISYSGGVRDVAARTLIQPRTGNIASGRVNAANTDSAVNNDSRGYFRANRINAVNHQLWRGAVNLFDNPDASVAVPAGEWYWLAMNRTGVGPQGFSTRTFAAGDLGGGLTEPVNGEITAAVNAVETYLSYVGAI